MGEVETGKVDDADGAGASASTRRWIVPIAVCAAVVLVGATAFVMTRSSSDDDAAFCAMLDAPPPASSPLVDHVVFMEPTATATEIDAVEEAIHDALPSATVRWVSQEEAFEEYNEIYTDIPEMLAAVTVESLPSSFRISTTPPASDVDLDSVEGMSGVFRVVEPLVGPGATRGEALGALFLAGDVWAVPLALAEDESLKAGVADLARDLDIDPGHDAGDDALAADLEIVAEALEALRREETPDSAVSSATERVLAAYDEYCTG